MQVVFVFFFLIVIGSASQRLYMMYRADGKIRFSIASFIACDIIILSIFDCIYIGVDPNYILGIWDNRVGLTMQGVAIPICICNILLIALYWEELLKSSTKASSFLVQYSKVYIVIVIVILSVHIALVAAQAAVSFAYFSLVSIINDYCTIIPAGLSALYCIINSIRIVVMIKKMDQQKLNKNDRKRKLDRTMLFIYVANFGLMMTVVSRLVDLNPWYWNYKTTLNDVQFSFAVLGSIICHLGVIFSFHTTRVKSLSSGSNSLKGKKSSKSTND